jgi:hypothetical protein
MNIKMKRCDGCGEQRPIWKNMVVDGVRNRLCKSCWSCQPGKDNKSKPTQRKPIAPRSSKRSQEEKRYAAKRVMFMMEHQLCQVNISGLCTQRSTDVHHKAGRVADLLVDETEWIAVCRACHDFIHTHPKDAREMGWLK